MAVVNMKSSIKVAFCGVVAALITAFMAISLIPNATFAAPAVAGLLVIAVFAQFGALPALGCYFASAVLSFFIADKVSWVLYVVFFGYYPIIKPALERIKNVFLKWAVKLVLFNLAACFCYFAERFVLGDLPGGILLAAVWLLGNIAFVLYDIAVSRIATFYYIKLHKKISAMLK